MRITVLLAMLGGACADSTGQALVNFQAAASAAPDIGAAQNQPLRFTTPRGFEVTLTTAKVFIGAMYFSAAPPMPASGATEAPCGANALVTGEVRGGLEVDALDPSPQPFPAQGFGTDLTTRSAAIWLTNTDVNAAEDSTTILSVEGEAVRGADRYPFRGQVHIGSNRLSPARSSALPSSNPICEQRIVDGIGFEATLREGGLVRLFIDARAFFQSVNFATLEQVALNPPRFQFRDGVENAQQADHALFNGLKANAGPYRFDLQSAAKESP